MGSPSYQMIITAQGAQLWSCECPHERLRHPHPNPEREKYHPISTFKWVGPGERQAGDHCF